MLLFFTYTDSVVIGTAVVVSRRSSSSRRLTALFAAITNTRKSTRGGRKIKIQALHNYQRPQLKSSRLLAVKKTASFQNKLDFIGSLDSAYDLNPTNRVSTSF